MPKGKLVRITPDTIKKLEKTRKGFETPNECINRILESRCNEQQKSENDDVVASETTEKAE